ncbi:MAG: molybdenum cofactor guanylyltransferase [Candidatus Lokiarchaeota archaeon]|nr:molybdenum cofactor guanylyltransferase [Candidatus Lokiarchaeota archaeon]
MENPKYLAILILIGGKSARFGIEKAAIDLLGKPLILHQIETLSKLDEDIFLAAHSEEQIFNYRKTIAFPKDVTFIIDDREIFHHPNIFRPMLGIYSGLKELKRLNFEKVYLLSCDMPLIKPEVIRLMIDKSKGFECCIPRWKNSFLEPFFAIYPVAKGLERARQILINENYGLHNFIDKSWKINYVPVEDAIQPLDQNLLSLMNINGPIDIAKVMNLYKKNI